ncbi:protealysin inhibitor emfourin [Billgrantia montanilacus]|uniref:protealysin inhibitor emfourin n=1 Tax=Billgrantia montanilacus TaxID=2282305 RepID=UPI0011C045B8|nr:protealysin inhibitor emfourin [Halomonas montanilacus]
MIRGQAEEPPALRPGLVLRLSREGGLAHFPGLARPRCVHCTGCSEEQLGELQSLLLALPGASVAEAGNDRRRFCVALVGEGGEVLWSQVVAEESAPQALLAWWRRAEIAPLQKKTDGQA